MMNAMATNSQVKTVADFEGLLATPFYGQVNAICWPRELSGDFSEIVDKIAADENVTAVSEEMLLGLALSPHGELARATVLNDMRLLAAHGAEPTLNVIKHYERDEPDFFFATDVYSFHVDRSTVPTDTILCTYHGAASDVLPNGQATQKILIPKIRASLKELYDGPEAGFDAFLREYFFDLHYQAKPSAKPISCGVGNLWRLAIDHPERRVPPCLHRAPEERDGRKRLLLIC